MARGGWLQECRGMRIVFTGMPLWTALIPLAAYLLAIGLVHLRRRPVAISGQVDALCWRPLFRGW